MKTVWVHGTEAVDEKHIEASIRLTYSSFQNVVVTLVKGLSEHKTYSVHYTEHNRPHIVHLQFDKAYADEKTGDVYKPVFPPAHYSETVTHL